MRRRGMTLMELMVAGVILTAVMTISLQLLRVTTAQHAAVMQRQTAIQETGNLMERLSAKAWDELTEQGVQDVQLSEQARQVLPKSELEIKLTSPPDEPDAKRITVSLRWQARGGRPAQNVRLVAWKYRGKP